MFNLRNPTEEQLQQQYQGLVEQLAKLGLKPEDVPRELEKLRKQIDAEISKHRNKKSA